MFHPQWLPHFHANDFLWLEAHHLVSVGRFLGCVSLASLFLGMAPKLAETSQSTSASPANVTALVDYVRGNQLDLHTINVLAESGHLPAIFSRLEAELQARPGDEAPPSSPSQLSDCSSAILLEDGRQLVVTYGGRATPLKGKGKGREGKRGRRPPAAAPPEPEPRPLFGTTVWRFGRKKKFHRQGCHQLRRPDVSAPTSLDLCSCADRLNDPETLTYVDLNNRIHLSLDCPRFDQATRESSQGFLRMRHCSQCTPPDIEADYTD